MTYIEPDSPIKNLQVFLHTISAMYPAVPAVIPDGIYGDSTMNAVKAFQKEFFLNPSGVTDNSTWDKVVDVYKHVNTAISNGNSAGIYPERGIDETHYSYYPTLIIIQAMLHALSGRFTNISAPIINGEFDDATRISIESFQLICGHNPDGNITKKFWNSLSLAYEVYISADRIYGN